jgi:uncharacterized membrane protein (DUF485 family)
MNPPLSRRSTHRPKEADWNRIATSPRFQHLLAIKKIFIVPAFLFFVVYYLLLPVLVGYAHD